jgi:hypothetical protein
LPPIGQGHFTTPQWPIWLPRTPSEVPATPQRLHCARHGAPLRIATEHEPDAEGHGTELGVYRVRVVVWCVACDRGVASEECVHFVPRRWRARGAQLLGIAAHDCLVREHALVLFHAFAHDDFDLYDRLYAAQEHPERAS